MAANNETGVRQPLDGVSALSKSIIPGGVITHTDAIAAASWVNLATVTATTDMISICAHKIGGPVNSGALVLRGDVTLEAVIPGGGQERGRRGGTVDVAAAVGLAAAVRLTMNELADVNDRVLDLQEKLVAAVRLIPDARFPVSAHYACPVPCTSPRRPRSDELLFLLDQEGVCASAAASCSSGAASPSHVLAAMGVSHERARGSLRLSMGAETTEGEVDAVIAILRASSTGCAPRHKSLGDWQTKTVKVLVAMSGGVDSSVAAGLLIEQGHEVVGATLKLWGGVSDSGCCSVADVDDARRVAQMLASITTSSTTPKSSSATSSRPSSRRTPPGAHRTRVSSATVTSNSTCSSSGPLDSASTRWRRATTPG